MRAKAVIGIIAVLFAMVQVGHAASNDGIQKYFNDAAGKVKAAADPVQKRDILSNSLQHMSTALDRVERMPLVSTEDRAGINQLKTDIQGKQDELAGAKGYERVPDAQLNDFSDYVVQDMEQAPETITISVVTLLVILLILVILLH